MADRRLQRSPFNAKGFPDAADQLLMDEWHNGLLAIDVAPTSNDFSAVEPIPAMNSAEDKGKSLVS